jgi:hypothetical protein
MAYGGGRTGVLTAENSYKQVQTFGRRRPHSNVIGSESSAPAVCVRQMIAGTESVEVVSPGVV